MKSLYLTAGFFMLASIAFAGPNDLKKAGPSNELAELNDVWGDFSFQTERTLFPDSGPTTPLKVQKLFVMTEGDEAKGFYCQIGAVSSRTNVTVPAGSTLIFSRSSGSQKPLPGIATDPSKPAGKNTRIMIDGMINSSQSDRALKIYLTCPSTMTLRQIEQLLALRLKIKGKLEGTLGVRDVAAPAPTPASAK